MQADLGHLRYVHMLNFLMEYVNKKNNIHYAMHLQIITQNCNLQNNKAIYEQRKRRRAKT